MARFVCPECGLVNIIRAEIEIRYSTPVRTLVRCQCGTPHTVYLERRAVRRQVDTPGAVSEQNGNARRSCVVRNLSRTGILVEIDGDTCYYQVGDRLTIEFELGYAAQRCRFEKKVMVRRIAGACFGAEFTPLTLDRELEHALAWHSSATV